MNRSNDAAPDVPLIPRKVLFGNPDRSMPQLSHDGKQLAFLAPVDGVMNVWVGPADDPAAAEPVTEDKVRGIRDYFWAYTNQHVIYVQDVGGEEDWNVFATDLEANRTRNLTGCEGVAARIQHVSPDHPDEILVGLNIRDPKYHDVYRLNIRTGERELVQENPEFATFITDDDYNVRLACRVTPDGEDEFLEPTDEGGWELWFKVSLEDSFGMGHEGFDRTGRVAYWCDCRGRDTSALVALDLESGEARTLAEDERCDLGAVLTHPTEKHPQAVTFAYERRRWEVLDEAVAEDFERLRAAADGDIAIVDRTLDDGRWIVAYTVDDGPVRYYLYERERKEARFLFSERDALEGVPLAKMRPVTIKSRDGWNLVCYLTLPPGAGGPVPMVLTPHGGPWARDHWGFAPWHQWLANRGYAVMSVNYRSSTGFGKAFVAAGNLEWAGKIHDDLIDAVRWAVGQGVADPDRVAIMGGSYGGYSALVGLTFTPEVFACAVDLVGPSNLVTLLNTIPPYWAPIFEKFAKAAGDPRTPDGDRMLTERSPLARIATVCRPLLIAQGANDPRVKQAESDQIVHAMQERDIPVTYLLYPDEGHGFARPENRMSFYAVSEAFLAQCLGGRFEPVGEDFEGSSVQVVTGAEHVAGLRRPADQSLDS